MDPWLNRVEAALKDGKTLGCTKCLSVNHWVTDCPELRRPRNRKLVLAPDPENADQVQVQFDEIVSSSAVGLQTSGRRTAIR